MTLTLRAVSLNDLPITQPIAAQFSTAGGTIGRADNNTLALPDPERRISRQQAQIRAGNSGYVITNVGSTNPIIVRNRSLAQGESAPLMHSDQVRIGGYLLEVVQPTADDDETTSGPPQPVERPGSGSGYAAASPLTTGGPASRSGGFGTSSALGDLNAPLSRNNPFADLLEAGSSSNRPMPPTSTGGPTTRPSARLPDDFDLFALPPTPAAPQRPEPSYAAGTFGDLIPGSAPASIDELFGLKPSGARDALAAFMADAGPAGGGAAADGRTPLSTDPMALFDGPGERNAKSPPPETAPDQTPELRAAFRPPQPMPAKPSLPPMAAPPVPAPPLAGPMPAPAVPAQASASAAPAPRLPVKPTPVVARAAAQNDDSTVPQGAPWSGEAEELWAAFCEGAGIKHDPAQGPNPKMMRVIGLLLRAAVEGTVQMMAVRSATRHELHAQVTVIRPRNNNPLKFSPDAQSAIEQLLQPPLRGFLPGPAAMTDAMNDLVGHAIGTMAGTRAALEGVLGRFAPQQLEAKLTAKSVLDSVLPMNRKAKLWELYLQHHEAIRDEAQEDFHALFGRAFLAAYEQQLDRLHRNKSTAPT